jgi:3-oxoadipate enol-lactonase
VRCDFRGQLRTPGPAHRELADNVDDVVALLDHLGLERVHVLGTSFGGEVALLLAARHPERVARLVAVTVGDHATEGDGAGGAAISPRWSPRSSPAAIPGAFHDALVADVYSDSWTARPTRELLAERRRQIAGVPDAWFAALDDLLAAIAGFDLRPELAAIRCPTLVVVAGDDRVMPPELGWAVAAAVPGALCVEHPTSGHALVAEQPDWLVARTLAFLMGSLP